MDSQPRVPRVAILGPVLVEDRSGALTEPAGSLGKSLIVALVLARGAVSVRSLVADVWDDAPPRQGKAALQTLVSRVRTASAFGLLESTATGYALAIDPEHTDLGLARAHLDRARESEASGDTAAALAEADSALALWRGEPGAELGDRPLADTLGRTAAVLRDELLRLRARAHRRLGDPERALADLEPLLAAETLDETLQLERMHALAEAGRRNDAIRAFGEFKEAMLDRLGTRPGAKLVALNASLLADEPDDPNETDDPRVDRRTARGPAPVRLGLRSAPNALIGREYDLDALEDLVATSRLTTVLGPGGLGKTRLAQELGHRASGTPAVVFVELASVRSADDITLAFASTLGIREARTLRPGDPGAHVDLRSRILGMLSERETLLIVDNCEHIVDAAAAWVGNILESTTTVRILATSRAPLAISSERVYPLNPLSSGIAVVAYGNGGLDGGDAARATAPAVVLFMERARAARPAVVLPADVVARLCDRLDGLPLAIELAAARTRSMSVEEIERRLGNRFALLTGGERTAPERHRTLLAVIDWSWNLLTTSERALLRRLSRFPDGFSAEAAELLSADGADTVLDDLEALVSQSLVSVAEDPVTGILRYRMLETVREFGDLALAEADETRLVQEGMYRWAIRFSRATMRDLDSADQVRSFSLITSEQDNLVAILRTALDERNGPVIVSAFSALSYYWSLRTTHSEVLAFGPGVLDALRGWEPEDDERDAAAATYGIIGGTSLFMSFRTAIRAIARLRRMKRRTRLAANRIEAATDLVQLAGREAPALALIAEYQASSERAIAAFGNLIAAQFKENDGDLATALQYATTAYDKSSILQDTWSTATAAQAMAQLHSQLAHPAEAIRWAEEARTGLTQLQAVGDLRQLDWIIATNAISAGDFSRGRQLLDHYVNDTARTPDIDDADYAGIVQAGLAEVAIAEGDITHGLTHYREAVGRYSEKRARTNPWLTFLASASLISHVRALCADSDTGESVDWAQVDEMARVLRTRILVGHRLRPNYIDKPILGAALVGVAGWMLAPRTDIQRTPEWREAGFELFAIVDRANGRQDLPSLNRAKLSREIREAWGTDGLDAALAVYAETDRNDAALRGLELLRDLRF